MQTFERGSVATLLRRYRDEAGLTQEEVAERAGLTTEAVSLLERGARQRPHSYTVQKLAEALALSPQAHAALQDAVRAARTRSTPVGALPTSPFMVVCAASADRAFVARLAADLQVHGIACWADGHSALPGMPDWEPAMRAAIRACVGVALVASRDAAQSRSVTAELTIAAMYRRPVYPIRMAGADEAWEDCLPPGLTDTRSIDARGGRYAAALAELVAAVGRTDVDADIPTATAQAEPAVAPRNPYKGLSAFTEVDACDFFGRDVVVDELVEALREALEPSPNRPNRLLTVVGPSGSGKSSVVMAGLLPRLKAGVLPGSETWVYLAPMVPGSHPLEALTVALGSQIDRSMHTIREDLDDDSSRGLHLLATRLIKRPETRVVLLIDQLEELFVQAADEVERQHLIDLLVAGVTEPRGPLLVIQTMRADFYHQAMRHADFWRLVEPHTRYVTPMAVEGLRAVIEQPAGLPDTRLTFERDLVGDLLFDVRGQEGALPLLEFTLDQLFQRREGHRLTLAAYRELGGVRGALAGHAEATYAALPSAEHRALARSLFLRLIEPGASDQDTTRRRMAVAELTLPDPNQTAMVHEVAAAFIAARLLVTNEMAGTSTLDVSHEALIRAWPRLYGWIQEDRAGLLVHRRLTEAAIEWQREHDAGVLYRGARLATALEWLQRANPTVLNEGERAFLEASLALRAREEQEVTERQRRELATAHQLAAAEQHRAEAAQALAQSERRRARIARSLTGGLAIVLVGALLAAFVAIQQSHQARAERDAAVQATKNLIQQQKITRSHDLAASALAQLGSNPEVSLLQATEAVRFQPTDQARDALRRALLASPIRAVLRGHTAAVSSAAFSPDGQLVVTASADNTARVWQVRTGQSLAVLRGHSGAVNSAAFSPDGLLVVTASQDGTARVWEVRTGRLVRILSGHTSGVNSAVFSPDGTLVVTASGDGTARVWQVRTGHRIATLRGHGEPVTSALFSPDGRLIATVGEDGFARVWQVRTGRLVNRYPAGCVCGDLAFAAFSPNSTLVATAAPDGTVQVRQARTGHLVITLPAHLVWLDNAAGAFSPDGTLVIAAGYDGLARVFALHTGRLVTTLMAHDGPVTSVAISPDSAQVVTAGADGTVRIWQAQTGQVLITLTGRGAVVNSVAFSPDGAQVVTASDDGTARIWQAHAGQELTTLRGHTTTVRSAVFTPDGTLMVTASGDKTARVWDARTGHLGQLVTVLRGHTDFVNDAVFSPDGTLVVTASDDGTARLWAARSGRRIAVLRGHTDVVNSAAFSPDGRLVVTASGDKTARVWDAHTGRPVATLEGHTGFVTVATFSPGGTRIVTASGDGTARVWAAHSGRPLAVLRGHTGAVNDAAFSPDGRLIVTASGDKTARVWDARTGRPVRLVTVLRGHTGAVNDAAFSPDGLLVVTASDDGTARLWAARSGRPIGVLRGHSDVVHSAVFSSDGTRIVTASGDGTVRVWDTRSGQSLVTFSGHTDVVNSAVFSPDGTQVLTASDDGTARVYSCDVCGSVADLLALAQVRASGHLTL